MLVDVRMVYQVGIGEMRLTDRSGEVLVASSIGAGIAIALHDPATKVSGLVHFMLPDSESHARAAAGNPCLFADTAIPAFLRAAAALGASPGKSRITMAGGAQPIDPTDFFAVGARNQAMARKILWKHGLRIESEHVGGTIARRLRLESGTGTASLEDHEREFAR